MNAEVRTRSQPARVLFVEGNDDETVGGSHRSMFDLIRLLDRARFTPVACFYRANAFVDRLRELGVEVVLVEESRTAEIAVRRRGGKVRVLVDTLRGIAWRRRLLRDLDIELVHINNSPLIAADDWVPAAWITGIPIISMARGGGRVANRRVRLLSRMFDRVVAVSEHMGAMMAANGISASRIQVVYNGIDLKAIRADVTRRRDDVRRELQIGEDQLFVLMAANVRRWKGQHVVLRAVAELPTSLRHRLAVLFVGDVGVVDREYRAELDALVTELDLSSIVRFLGWSDDLPSLLAAADVSVHSSTSPEPFGRILVESMALGTPLVAARLGGPLEVLTADSGRLFDPARPAELTALLMDLIQQPTLREQLSAGGLQRAEAFTVEAMVDSMSLVYESVLQSRARPRTH